MRKPERDRLRDDVRAASEIIGVVLLIGMVFLGAWLVVVYGSSIIDQVRDQNDQETAKLVVQELDSRLGTLAQLNDVGRIRFDIGSTDPDDMVVRDFGKITVTVNRRSACTAELPLSSVRYENQDGATVAYEAGGVFQTANREQGGSTMLTAPDVSFRDGTLDVTVVNVSGQIDESINEAVLNVEKSRAATHQFNETVSTGDCIRPDNVTLKVQSDFYNAWADYLQSVVGSDSEVQTNAGNETAWVHLPQEALPPETNDEKNDVVGMTNPDYMTEGSGSGVTIDSSGIKVNKGESNTYQVQMRPLAESDLELGQFKEEVIVRDSRTPTDVVFILDESGSMQNTDGDSATRAREIQDGAQLFHANLNSSLDRTGVVTFDNGDRIRTTPTGLYLSSDFGECGVGGVNQTICALSDYPNGGTQLYEGIRAAHKVLDLNSNQTRNKVAVLLTDGRNNGCYDGDQNDDTYNGPSNPSQCTSNRQETREAAREAAKSGITIYTIGYPKPANIGTETLKDVADITGGEYYQSTTSGELKNDFADIAKTVSSEEAIVRTPVTSVTSTAAGDTYAPYIAGDTDRVARVTIGGKKFPNINDPTAPSVFRQKFPITGGEKVEFGASWYGCKEYVTTPITNQYNGESHQVARCAEIDESDKQTLSNSDIRVYRDGDDLTNPSNPKPNELVDDAAAWQETMRQSLMNESMLDSPTDTTIELASNQALVIYDFPDTPNSGNRLPVLYEVGLSEEEARAPGVVNLRIRYVNLSAKS